MSGPTLLRRLRDAGAGRIPELDSSPVNLRILGVVVVLISSLSAVAIRLQTFSILYFPPLAAASYKLFRPTDRQPRLPWQFPVAFTYSACSGWVALVLTRAFFAPVPPGQFQVDPIGAILSLGLAGIGLWLLRIELPPALAASLLLPFARLPPVVYVLNVAAGSTLVTLAFLAWRPLLHRLRHHS